MGTTIFMAVLVLLIIVGLIVGLRFGRKKQQLDLKIAAGDRERRYSDDEYTTVAVARVVGWAVSGVSLVLLLLVFVFSCLTIIPTKEVGIELTFAKPTGTLTNGLHVKAPWQDITTMDAAIQTDTHTTDTGKSTCSGGIPARIAHQTVACVDVSIRWRIVENQAGALFQNYRDFDNVRNSLVTRELTVAINQAMEGYDPLAVDDKGNSTTIQLSQVSDQTLSQLKSEIGSQIEVLSVLIPVVHFDSNTQSRINALQAQIAQTRIAEQAEQTAKAQANANAALAASVSKDPNVIVSKCFDLLNEMVNKGQSIPPGFSCWPGGSGVGVIAKQ